MADYLSIDEIEEQSRQSNITAMELDILASKTRDLTALRRHELDKLTKVLTDLEARLAAD